MRILGIDCGTERTGYGIIESDGRVHQFIGGGLICTKASLPLHTRLLEIAVQLRRVVAEFTPEMVSVEEVFHAVNAKSALKLAHVRGVALLIAAEAGLPLYEYSPLEVKVSVVGYGRAEKQQVQSMVAGLLRLPLPIKSFDTSDALAVAICHGARAKFANLTESAVAGARH